MHGSSLTAASNGAFAMLFVALLGLGGFITFCYYVISWLVS